MEAKGFTKMLLPTYRNTRTRRNIPEDRNLNLLRKIISHVCKSPLRNIPLTCAKQINSFENTCTHWILCGYSTEFLTVSALATDFVRNPHTDLSQTLQPLTDITISLYMTMWACKFLETYLDVPSTIRSFKLQFFFSAKKFCYSAHYYLKKPTHDSKS